MRRHSGSLVVGVIILTALSTAASPRAQGVTIVSGDFPAPGTVRELPKGTGLIVGRVIDGDSRRPVDRAVVYLSTPLGVIDPVMTDAQGRFVFRNLPKGQYQLRSIRPGHVDGAYAKRSADEERGRDGRPLILDEDERLVDVSIVMWKFASITGTVTDEAGEPVVDATVRALPRRMVSGRWLFDLDYRAQSVQTDDRGTFRLASLPPGEYVVVVPAMTGAVPRITPPSTAGSPLADSAISAGRWFGGSGTARGPGIDVGDPGVTLTTMSFRTTPGFAGLTKDGKILAYTTAFYSNAATLSRATAVPLRSGEAREGINIQLTPVPTSRVSGTLTGPSGPASMLLRLVSTDLASATVDAEIAQAISDAAGHFTFLGVPPGDYRVLVCRTPVAPAPSSQSTVISTAGGPSGLTIMSGSRLPPDDPTEWADTAVSVSSADVSNVEVTLRTGFRIRGGVQFEGTGTPPAPERVSTVYIERADGREPANSLVQRGGVDAQGNLRTYGQSRGAYFVRVPSAPPGWRFKGAMHGGRDVSLLPLEVSNGDVEGVTLIFTDQPASEISGSVSTVRGEPAPAASVVVFPADRQYWTNMGSNPRNLRAVAVGSGSRYLIADLPPGAYLVAPTMDSRPGWADPKFLDTLVRAAQKITIADGEKRTLDLRLPAGTPEPSAEGEVRRAHGPWVPDTVSVEHDGQPGTRDAGQAPPVGSAVITGVVTTAGDRAQPVRRASVTLTGGGLGSGRLAITDETGRFEFLRLAPGRYSLSATKPAYLTTSYGAARPERPGTPIELTAGQRMTDVTLKLQRGAVISGVIRDDRGQPAAGIGVQAMSYRTTGGERRLLNAGQGSLFNLMTDDRGAYRIYGLAPGDYVVIANSRAASGSFRMTTDADVEAALQAAKPSSGRAGTPTSVARAPQPASMSYAPTFFPGTADLAAATTLTLGLGEEKTGIDFAVGFVPTAVVAGTVGMPSGSLPTNIDVRIVNTGRPVALSLDFGSVFPIRPDPDGSFRFRAIVPGRYTVVATTAAAGGRGGRQGGDGAGASAMPLWATADVTVNGTDISGLTLSLQPGMTVSGRIEYRPTSRPVPSLSGTRVLLAPQLTGSQISVGQLQVSAKDDGSFAMTGVMPGRYAVRVLPPTGSTGWLLSSAILKNSDWADHLLEVRPNEDVTDIAVAFIDQPSELAGVLQDAGGRPAPDYTVILFSADRAMWRSGSRRIFQVRPATDGKFQFRSLVAGDYLLAAVTDVESGEWFDPKFLAELAKASVAVTIATGESKTQDIRIAR
jgi:protocatechuate 3,4-dioxygenase beta subunit